MILLRHIRYLFVPFIFYFSVIEAHAELLCPKSELKSTLLLQSSDGQTQLCNMSNLDNLPQEKILTNMPSDLGIKGKNEWRGVSLKYIAQNLGAKENSIVELVALNDYIVEIPMKSINLYNPVLASHFNGKTLSVRNKGPLILIYPFDKYKEINIPLYQNYSIWMINEIRVK